MDNQITYNEALIDERDQGIAEISQQIGEVNEIFQVRLSSLFPFHSLRDNSSMVSCCQMYTCGFP